MPMKPSKKIAINALASISTASLVGISIFCAIQDHSSNEEQAKKNQQVFSNADKSENQSVEQTQVQSTEKSNGLKKESILNSIKESELVKPINQNIDIHNLDVVTSNQVADVTFSSEKMNIGTSNQFSQYQQALDDAIQKLTINNVNLSENSDNLKDQIQNLKISVPINDQFLETDDQVVATLTHSHVEKNEDGSSALNLKIIFSWLRQDLVMAIHNDFSISLPLQ